MSANIWYSNRNTPVTQHSGYFLFSFFLVIVSDVSILVSYSLIIQLSFLFL